MYLLHKRQLAIVEETLMYDYSFFHPLIYRRSPTMHLMSELPYYNRAKVLPSLCTNFIKTKVPNILWNYADGKYTIRKQEQITYVCTYVTWNSYFIRTFLSSLCWVSFPFSCPCVVSFPSILWALWLSIRSNVADKTFHRDEITTRIFSLWICADDDVHVGRKFGV